MRFALLLTGVLALAVVLPGSGVAAEPIVNEHSAFSDTIPDEICGIPGTSTVIGVDNFKLYADGTFLDTSRLRQVFTSDSTGKQVQISAVGQVSGLRRADRQRRRNDHVHRYVQGPSREAVDPERTDALARRGKCHVRHDLSSSSRTAA